MSKESTKKQVLEIFEEIKAIEVKINNMIRELNGLIPSQSGFNENVMRINTKIKAYRNILDIKKIHLKYLVD